MKKWEYLILGFDWGGDHNDGSWLIPNVEELNRLGTEGWELVSCREAYMAFKRELVEASKGLRGIQRGH